MPRRFTLILAALLLAGPARADLLEGFRDPQDGKFDLSEWLLDRKGVLPVPLLITEPALGLGGGRQDRARRHQQDAADSENGTHEGPARGHGEVLSQQAGPAAPANLR